MKILVTGGGGFLGQHICRDLIEAGYEVYSFSRNHYDHLDEINVQTRKGSLVNKEEIKSALIGIDAVFHTAAVAGVWGRKEDFYNTNYTGTQNLVDTCLDLGIKYFINTSSPSVVFGKEDILGADESIAYPAKYLTYYAESKALAEKYALSKISNSFHVVSLRPHLIFGKGDPHIVPKLLESARKGRLKIVGTGSNLVDVIHVKNAASAHVQAFNKLIHDQRISGRSYFIGQEAPVNLWDFINKILALKGEDAIVEFISFSKAYKVGAVLELVYKLLGINKPQPPMTRFVATQLGKNHYFNHDNAKKDFNFKIILDLEEALKDL